MVDVDRHRDWYQWPISGYVRGSTVIDKGDLLFLDRANSLRNNGASTANNSVYPFATIGGTTKTLASNQELAADNFLGVAMYDSDSGVTENIAIAIAGLFKFPLRSAQTVYLCDVIMPAGSGSSLFSQKVSVWQSGSTYAIGQVQRARTRPTSVEFRLRPTVVGIGDSL